MDSRTTDFVELRATLNAMMQTPRRVQFAYVLRNLLDLNHVSEIDNNGGPLRYMITGVRSLEDVANLIGLVENPVQVAMLELSVLGLLSFGLETANLRFFAIKFAE